MKSKFLIFIGVIVIVVIALGVFMDKSAGPGKYDDFAKALGTGGAEFYGAFWCPHCQDQKTQFGTSKKYLPYIECSNPNQSQTQVCLDKKIESYPTWYFKDGTTITSAVDPIVCKVKPGTPDEPSVCANASSAYDRTWVFPGYEFSIKSPTDPIRVGEEWKFAVGSYATGEIPLLFLAKQIGFTLPQ